MTSELQRWDMDFDTLSISGTDISEAQEARLLQPYFSTDFREDAQPPIPVLQLDVVPSNPDPVVPSSLVKPHGASADEEGRPSHVYSSGSKKSWDSNKYKSLEGVLYQWYHRHPLLSPLRSLRTLQIRS